MSGIWIERPFEEVIDFREGPGILAKDFREDGTPLVRLAGLNKGYSVLEGCNYLDPNSVAKRWNQFRLELGDILLSSSASLGRIAVVGEEGIGAIPYTGIIRMRPRDSTIYGPFIRYLLEGPHFQQQSEMVGVGSVIRHFGPTHLRQMTLKVPPLPEQRRIAHILGTLDDKIELNRRMNQTLEQMARAIFQDWFVDFGPTRAKLEGREPYLPPGLWDLFPDRLVQTQLGEAPEGWGVRALDEIAEHRNGLALQKFRPEENEERLPVVKIAQLRTGKADGNEWAKASITPDCIIDDGDVVFSWSGSLMVKVWCGGHAALNQHLFKVTSSEYPKWFYLRCIEAHLSDFQDIAKDKATTMGHIKREHLSNAKRIVPSQRLLAAVDETFANLLSQQIESNLQSVTLAAQRDALLPGLVGGAVGVGNLPKCEGTLDGG